VKNYFPALLINITLIAFLIANLCGCVKQKQHGLTIKQGVLSVGVEVGYPPMEYYDTDSTTLLGFDVDLTNALAKKLGLKIHYIDTAWEGILAGLDANRYDIAVNITILPERQKRFNFTKPYIDSSMTIVTRKNSESVINKPEDIAGFRTAFQGDTTAQYFTERLSKHGIVFTPYSYEKIIYCFNDLLLGRVDLVVVDNIVASNYIGKDNSPYKIVWQGKSDEYIGFCLKKGNDDLTAALNSALDELFAEGIIQEISQKIFKRDLITHVFSDTINNHYE